MSLVLTRRPHEKIMIGNDIVIEVKEVRGNNVTIAITAPKEVSIDREEIYIRKRDEPKAVVSL